MNSLKEIAEKLFKEKSVAIFIHVRPDGDAIGSASALKLALESKGIKADLFCEDAIPERFSYLNVISDFSAELKDEYSALFACDCAEIYRLGKFGDAFMNHKNTYSVDHHISNRGFSKFFYVSDTASNCENVYKLLKISDINIDRTIAERLLTGVVTDTGAFRHKNVTPETLKVASELLKFGADLNNIIYKNFHEQSKERAKLFGTTMAKLRYFEDGKLAIATVSLADLYESGAKQDETEGFIDFVMGIDSVLVGVCMLETEKDKYKISFRSKGVDVNAVAGEFGGGGHTLASGCKIAGEYEEVVDKIRFAVYKYLPEI